MDANPIFDLVYSSSAKVCQICKVLSESCRQSYARVQPEAGREQSNATNDSDAHCYTGDTSV